MKKIDLTGRRFGRLVVIREDGHRAADTTWLCVCDCGQSKSVRGGHLRSGHAISCGCGGNKRNLRHGQSETSLYYRWQSMLQRCNNPNHKRFADYGGRRIQVCARWHSFENFAADVSAGFLPGLTLDRRDNDGNYDPANCRWSTPAEQASNRRHKSPPRVARRDIDGSTVGGAP